MRFVAAGQMTGELAHRDAATMPDAAMRQIWGYDQHPHLYPDLAGA